MAKKKKTTSVFAKSEFWVTMATSISGLLLAFGIITPEQSNSVAAYVPNIVGAIMSLLSTLGFIQTQNAAKVEVFRAMCAANLDGKGQFKAQGVETPEDRVCEVAKSAGL